MWQERAACADAPDPDLFHPAGKDGTPRKLQAEAEALAYCSVCPVWRECLEWAASSTDSWRYGVVGGLTEGERSAIWSGGKPDLKAALQLARVKRQHPAGRRVA